jgi:hypothetical protein
VPEIHPHSCDHRLTGPDGHRYALMSVSRNGYTASGWWVVRLDVSGRALEENGTRFRRRSDALAEFDRLTGRHRDPVGT